MTRRTPHTILLICILLGGLSLAGCSTFNRDWKNLSLLASSDPATAAPDAGLVGRWKGTWHSDKSGHGGGLRCIIARGETNALLARYHATYGGFMTFEYSMPMEVREEGDTYRFSAQADLGWLAGGVYEYEGAVVGDAFSSTYKCKGDHGTFEMQRIGPEPPE